MKSDRVKNFEAVQFHPMMKKWWSKMKPEDIQLCRDFLEKTKDLEDDQFIFKVNRMFVDTLEAKPKAWTAVCDCLSASVTVQNMRGRRGPE